jgi:hypothetical protein
MITKYPIYVILAVALLIGSNHRVLAQSDAQRRQAAAEAYDRGTAAYLAGNFTQSAQWFETANRMAPAAAALMQAIRAHRNGGNDLRAATLALQLSIKYPQEPAVAKYGSDVLNELAGKYLRIEVTCGGCSLDLDGTLQEYLIFFTEPGVSHSLVAHFDAGDVKEDVSGSAGETKALAFELPVPGGEVGTGTGVTAPGGEGELAASTTGTGQAKTGSKSKGLSPVYTLIGGGVTVALGVTTAVLGVSVIKSKDDFDKKYPPDNDNYACRNAQTACEKDYQDGVDKQTLTNVFIGITAGMGVLTAVVGIFFTDWSKKEKKTEAPSAGVLLLPGGGAFTVRANF